MTVPTAPLLPVPRLVLDQRLQVFPGIEEVEPRLEDDVTHVHRARSGEVVGIQRDVVILRAEFLSRSPPRLPPSVPRPTR
jgi:hypothetical protein